MNETKKNTLNKVLIAVVSSISIIAIGVSYFFLGVFTYFNSLYDEVVQSDKDKSSIQRLLNTVKGQNVEELTSGITKRDENYVIYDLLSSLELHELDLRDRGMPYSRADYFLSCLESDNYEIYISIEDCFIWTCIYGNQWPLYDNRSYYTFAFSEAEPLSEAFLAFFND